MAVTLFVQSLLDFWADCCPLTSPSIEITERARIGDDLVFERMVSEL